MCPDPPGPQQGRAPTPRKRTTRLYTRDGRYYADLRDYSDVGGGREALKPEGQSWATTDADEAARLLADRLDELDDKRQNRKLVGTRRLSTLAKYAAQHLVEMARGSEATDAWIARTERQLKRAIDYLGAERELNSIRPSDIRRFIHHLRKVPNGHGRNLSEGSIRHCLNSLSGMHRRAQEDEAVPPGYNPVAALKTKPTGRPVRTKIEWLEIHDAVYELT